MSKIDTLDIIPIFGEIGFLKGCIGGLIVRLDGGVPAITDDLIRLQKSVNRIDKHLSGLMGEEDEQD